MYLKLTVAEICLLFIDLAMRLVTMCLVHNDYIVFLTSVEVMYLYNLLSIIISLAFSALMLLVRWQEGHPTSKKLEW